MVRTILPVVVCSVFAVQSTPAASAQTYVVCPEDIRDPACGYAGGSGIQAAIDAAASGDAIFIRAGRYAAEKYRDVSFKTHTIRGFAVIDGKDLSIAGETGTILDGTSGPQTTAIVVRSAAVSIRGLTLTGFRFGEQEDEIYEGHGVFVIDSQVRVEDVVITRFQKMALTGRGQSQIDARRLRIEDGHVAIWLRESAQLRLRDSIVRNNDGTGIAAYASSVAHVANSVFDNNQDDGIYAGEDAVIFASNSVLLQNRPVGASAVGHGSIRIDHCAVFRNEVARSTKDTGQVVFGPNVIESDPRLDASYRPAADSPLLGKGDPDLGRPIGLTFGNGSGSESP